MASISWIFGMVKATELQAGDILSEDGHQMTITHVEFTDEQIIMTLAGEGTERRAINAGFFAARPRS